MTSFVQIPLTAVQSQTLSVSLSGNTYELALDTLATGLYLSITRNDVLILSNLLCQDRTWLIRKSCYGADGDFAFIDTLGTLDPVYRELNSRYLLLYCAGQNVG